MRCKILALFSLAASALVFSGCRDEGTAQMAPEETNVLGIYKNVQESYASTPDTSFVINSDELYTRKNFSGDKTSLLWGLIVIEDY